MVKNRRKTEVTGNASRMRVEKVGVEHKRLLISNIANFRVRVLSTLKLVKQLTFKTLRSTHEGTMKPSTRAALTAT